MLDALARLGDEIFKLIRDNQYFIVHAPRQSGKTTLLLELTRRLNAEGQYYALYCSLENLQGEAE
jgi:predicted AAA+ superfamily ATPase